MMNGHACVSRPIGPAVGSGGGSDCCDHRQRLHGSPHHRCRGNAEDVAICAPACALSLDENNTTTLPYAVCSLTARKPGYRTVRIQGIQIFAGQVTLARPEMIPDTEEGKDIVDPPVIIPTHALFAGNGGSGPAPTNPCTGSRVLDRVIVPKNITVHLANRRPRPGT